MNLQLLFELKNISSASGIVKIKDKLYIIGDDNPHLLEVTSEGIVANQFVIIENESQISMSKKRKWDLESMFYEENEHSLFILPSGSTPNRETGIQFDLNSKSVKNKINLYNLYKLMKEVAGLDDLDLNLEGCDSLRNQKWIFANRGNGFKNQNGIFIVEGEKIQNPKKVSWQKIDLPIINGDPASFTDIVVFNNSMYFLATIEQTTSTYEDGIVCGSMFGKLDLSSKKIETIHKVTDTYKLEGLCFANKNGKESWYATADNDDPTKGSSVFLLE